MFRGTAAVAAGLVTPAQLRGPRYRRLFPDVYIPEPDTEPDLELRSRAAFLLVTGRGVLSGCSAAELLGASCGPEHAPAEVTVPGGGQRAHPGLVVHRDGLAADELCRAGDVLVTSPVRTAYDLARWSADLAEAVVAVDTLANRGRFAPAKVLRLAERYPRSRGRRRLPRVVELAGARSGSPMESRLRMLLVLAGLPVPEVQFPVADERTRTAVWIDLAYPEHRIGIEYEGGEHWKPERVLRDAGRYTKLVDEGWRMYRFTKKDVYCHPSRTVDRIARALRGAL